MSGDLLGNDTDPNGDPLSLNTTPVSGTTNGTVVINPDGTYTYTPDPGFTGTDQFTYTICDPDGLCDTATVYITVNHEFDPDPDVHAGALGDTLTGDVSTNDNVPDGTVYGNPDPNPSNPSGSMPTINPDGTYTFTSDTPGVYTFEVPI